MNIQQWLTQLLSRPAGDPIDWESYRITMDNSTWRALWQDIDASQAYEDGLEAGLRLLQATQRHRLQLGQRGYEIKRDLLYRSILAMLDKADRWDAYVAAWETISAQTSPGPPARAETPAMGDPRLAPFMRRASGGLGVPSLPYGAPPPRTVRAHFLDTQLRRKALIERKLAQERAGTLLSDRRHVGRDALTGEEIQSRLAQIRESAG